MNDFERDPNKIIHEFFRSVQQYVRNAIVTKENLMNYLCDFFVKAWEVPKKYKGNSGQMGFIPEYLVFETVKQYIAKKNTFSILPIVRTKTFQGNVETYYFINDQNNPTHLLCQGLQVYDTALANLGLPKTKYAHDITYLVKEDTWLVKTVFEVKSYFDTPSLKEDIDRLIFAEENYRMADNFALVFVGFKDKDWLSIRERALIFEFTKGKNNFCILPGEKDQELGNSKLEDVLNFIS